jgi:cellulose synthase/poly-beta-1,6-N-acetylglucosamine synthase-like glycosyltransferase
VRRPPPSGSPSTPFRGCGVCAGIPDYPASKLDIKLVFEETDEETYAAAKALALPGNFEFIRVPHSLPLTKPKACNYALPFARGTFLVIYDAEDLPEPDQLRRAVAAFRLGDDRLACVQAQLNYYNWFENWLTRQFALEYASYFDLLLPMLAKFGLPVPLGGTSTHFRTHLLRAVGAWDPFNVTEDADLGMRFAVLGLRTGIIRSTTQEEANCRLDNWLRQRSRWIKGWMQTYLVRMRHPIRLYRALGFRGFIGFQIIIGGSPLSSLVHPLFYLSAMQVLIEPMMLSEPGHRATIAFFDLFVLVVGYGITVMAGMAAAAGRGLRPLILHALMMPAYWLLISAGAYKALFQLARRPFHWEKTEHGISRMTEDQLTRVRMARNFSR